MKKIQRITPYLWFTTQAEEAAKHYTSIFNNSKIGKTTSRGDEGAVMTIEFELDGQPFVALNGGPMFKFTEAVSFLVHCEDQAELDYYWDRLSEGGDEKAQNCGWLKDKFGVSWQVVPAQLSEMITDSDPEKSGRVMKALLQTEKKIDLQSLIRAYEGKKDLIITRTFDAPVEQVYKAWHDPEMIKQWWGPDGFSCPQATIDFREGGVSLVCMRAPQEFGGQDSFSTWHYTAIVPNERIEFIHNLAYSDGSKMDPRSIGMPADFPQDQRQVITFKDLGNGRCELTVIEYDWTVGKMMEMSRMGMEQCLNKIAAVVS